MARQRVDGYRRLHATFESLRTPQSPEGAPPRSIHEGLSELVRPVLDWWDDLGRASADQLDYWGRGNFVRALRHLGRYPRAFTIVVEARTRADIERSLRLCGLVADVVLVLWKGPCREGSVLTVAPLHHDGPGGAGYILAAGDRLQREGVRGTVTVHAPRCGAGAAMRLSSHDSDRHQRARGLGGGLDPAAAGRL